MVVPRSTKGAMKMFETIGVLFVFMMLLGLAMVFYNVIQQSMLEETLAKQAERKSLEIAGKSLLLPELDCSLTGITEINCIDMAKLYSFSNIINSSTRAQSEYFNIFENSHILVRPLWPGGNWSIVLYSNVPAKFKSKNIFVSPILLHDPWTGSDSFGIIEVETYAQ